MTAMSRIIETYLDDLNRLSISPYLNDEVMTALKIIASGRYESANDYTKLKTDRALMGSFPQQLTNTRSDILNIIILPVKGPAYLTAKGIQIRLVDSFAFEDQPWYQDAILYDGRAVFVGAHTQHYLINRTASQVFSVARLIKDPDSGQPLAVILVDADNKILERVVKDIVFHVSTTTVVVDQHDNVLYADQHLSAAHLDAISRLKDDSIEQGDEFAVVSRTIKDSGWRVAVFLSNDELQAKVQWIYIIALLLSLGALLITLGVFFYITRWVVHPFRKMNGIMRKVKQGDMSDRYTPKGNDEIDQLGVSLNIMVARLDDLINRELRATIAQRNAEYLALQSQIQPHFLYNTLNGFIGLNREGETRKLEKAILSLSSMLRYSLQDRQTTTIGSELEFIERYCTLQQLRFEEKLEVSIYCDPDTANFSIPKLLIQPIVENAIIHGVEPDTRHNLVSVHTRLLHVNDYPTVVITVSDNGVGFDPDRTERGERVGMENVRTRLLMFAPDAIFSMESQPGVGTTVTMSIPYKENTG